MAKLWDKISKSVADGVTVAAEKTEEYTKLGRAKLDVLATKRKITKQFTELGGMIYDKVKEGKEKDVLKTDDVQAAIAALKTLDAELDEKEAKYEELKPEEEAKEKEK